MPHFRTCSQLEKRMRKEEVVTATTQNRIGKEKSVGEVEEEEEGEQKTTKSVRKFSL